MAEEASQSKARIRISRGGPYVVSGGVPLVEQQVMNDGDGMPYAWKEGKRYPSMKAYSLCRCGGSKRKPFCDATHVRTGFKGDEVRKKLMPGDTEVFDGPELVLSDIRPYCSKARFCRRGSGVWQLTTSPQSEEDTAQALEMSSNCPAGRLVHKRKATGEEIEPELEPSIGVIFDPLREEEGPLWVRGGIIVEGADGHRYQRRNRVTLCRCGRSESMPFCDRSHAD